MSAASEGPLASADGVQRFRLIAHWEAWKRSRLMLFYGAALMVIGTVITRLGSRHQWSPSFLIIAAVLLLIAWAVYLWAGAHYVEIQGGGLELRAARRRVLIPFDQIRQVRCQSLQQLFDAPNRRKLLPSNLRQFRAASVCTVRLNMGGEELARVSRLVGRKTVIDQDLILLVEHAEALETGLQQNLPRRAPAPSQKPTRRR